MDENVVGTLVSGKRSREGSRGTAFPSLPVPHRLAILYLMTPLVIWLVGWFQWWFGIPAWRRCWRWGCGRRFSGSWRVSLRPTDFVLLLIAAGWVMVTAAGGVFDDQHIRLEQAELYSSILATVTGRRTCLRTWTSPPLLALLPWLLHGTWTTRQLFGVATLNWAVPLWTWCGVALMLTPFTRELSWLDGH